MKTVLERTMEKKGFRFARCALIVLFLLAQGAIGRTTFAGTNTPQEDGDPCTAELATDCPQLPFKYVEVKSVNFVDAGKSNRKWRVAAFQDDQRWSGPAELRFCTDTCPQHFTAVNDNGHRVLDFQEVKELTLAALVTKGQPPVNAVLFLSEHSAGGSGRLEYLTLWTYRSEAGEFRNILPRVLFTDQGEYKLFPKGIGTEPLVVVASFIWGEGETHFARHRYEIRIYKFSSYEKTFAFHKKYTTKTKYPGFDETDRINVITPELKNIKRLVK